MNAQRVGWIWISLLATLGFAPTTSAAPRSTAWLEDTRLERRGFTGTTVLYEHQAADLKATSQGFDLLTLRLAPGIADALELGPVVRLRQRGSEPLQLQALGAEIRGRVRGTFEAPRVLVYGGYLAGISEGRDHLFWGGGAGRYELGRVFFGGDLRLGFATGGAKDRALETWLGGAAGYAFLENRNLTLGLETFLIAPLAGDRISDPTFGLSGSSSSYYVGPSVSAHVGPLWTAASAVTGLRVMNPSSDLLVRWTVGVSY